DGASIDVAIAAAIERQAKALLVGPDALFAVHTGQIIALATRNLLPTISGAYAFGNAGGLMRYGTSQKEAHRQVGVYAGRILRGTKPADLPVYQSTKVELVVNLKTAKSLGITVPSALLARADEVIE